MERNTTSKLTSRRVGAFLKRLQQLAWFELFEKWFGVGVKLLWITLFIAFCVYLQKEYRRNIFYVQDFKVPPAWIEQGYSGEVVKQAILDEIDNIMNGVYASGKSMSGSNEDNIELLNELTVEGFNLKAVTKSILALLGKKDKSIGGYVTLSDSTQTVAIQVTNEITQPLSIKRNEPAQHLIHKAAMEIMKVRSPKALIYYYMVKKDADMVNKVYSYLKKRRGLMDDYYFYMTSAAVALNSLDYEEALAWSDSAAKKFPNDKLTYYIQAEIHMTRLYNANADSTTTQSYKRLFVENMRKVSEPGLSDQSDNLAQTANQYLLGFYARENDLKSFSNLVERTHMEQTLNAPLNNVLAYAYMSQKKYKKAEEALHKAIAQAGHVGDYWDSLAEVYSIQGKDSLAVVSLVKALRSPQKSGAVSAKAYQTDTRWKRLFKRPDFQQVVRL
ncbi:tetratricopeptide repeat protein [Fibrivirga algicola]|uniref:Tetratricopeptide repeat protein n=1 Tax=Fibrivirga algicola TaxID=2950420 RepID=A0ABX0QKA0_9BACT|nr:hypothetical protein [Fibrivirga algicola]ARK12808.1 hypothetical protein A6C57_22100 [Fibrella sp. ES10-3-2-2]NID12879.1 hypothetical protein [Fibrivirga algicola]